MKKPKNLIGRHTSICVIVQTTGNVRNSRNTRKGVVPGVTVRCPMMAGQGKSKKAGNTGQAYSGAT